VPGNADPGVVDIQKFLPEAYHGAVIITTRSAEVKLGCRIRVRKLGGVRESLEILSHASGRECDVDGKRYSVVKDSTLTFPRS
jgi:hypothetical protein